MSQQPLDYQTPSAERPRRLRGMLPAIIVASATVVANGVLVGIAASDRSYLALGVAIMAGPITNGVIFLLSLACIPLLKIRGAGPALGYLGASMILPIAAVVLDFMIIKSMSLHGC